ncbi:MAG: DUF484 family protein [Plesiomonas sp.]|uniref:DUF484 family protein n=1 Tax=Plesiomonas sp. TaxID=2486279 RepID=UPI003F2FAB95
MSEYPPRPPKVETAISGVSEATIDVQLEQRIAHYLIQHPAFFNRHAPLLDTLQIPHHSHGAISLIERQLLQLRQTVDEYQQQQREQRLQAAANEQLFLRLLPLQHDLLMATDLNEGLRCLQEWSQQLGLLACRVHLFSDRWLLGAPSAAHGLALRPEQFALLRIQRFGGQFRPNACYLGPLNASEQLLLLPDIVRVGSVALQRIGQHAELGLLIFASRDPQHFQTGMGTQLLQSVAQIIELVIQKWVARRE